MENMINLSNGILDVAIEKLGAQLKSMKKNGKEYLKTEVTSVWEDSAPVLFPICGCLKDGKYTYSGKEYKLGGHGFAYKTLFEAETVTKDSVTFLIKADEETKKVYPFQFEFRVKYVLNGDTLEIEYETTNCGENDMYFSVGSHEGYVCPLGIEDYSIIFDETENLEISLLDGVLLNGEKKMLAENECELKLKYEYYDFVDTLVFENLKSRRLTLKNRVDGTSILLDFNSCDNLLVWTAPGEKYICIEPWAGLPDFADTDYDITKKAGIIKLAPKMKDIRKHSIKFE